MDIDLTKVYSHSNKKTLEDHTLGVWKKSSNRSNNILLKELIRISVFFHDVGKLNVNFQAKLFGQKKEGLYSKHSLLSAYSFLSFLFSNIDYFKIELKNDFAWVFAILEIIKKHHSHLSNLDENLDDKEKIQLCAFLEKNTIFAYDFIQLLGLKYNNSFDIKKDKNILLKLYLFRKDNWQLNPLKYFSYTQFAFASLIEADKRDAGDLYQDIWWKDASEYSKRMAHSLSKKFLEFSASERSQEPLNQLRTELRLEACHNISKLLDKGQRLFSLTAPTGAGKTFTLLSLAKEIQAKNTQLGIIYCLPFLSITEQVEYICTHEEELGLKAFSANSRSINKRLENIQKRMESNPSEALTKEFLGEAYKAQTFDHPFIITTFVQFFETLVSNRNSTLLKLPNFANRIFLIDEIQAIPPTLYIFFAAWLDNFCRLHNSYVVFSSATMPDFRIPDKATKEYAKNLFPDYQTPEPLIESDKYFSQPIFNRYEIIKELDEGIYIEDLAEKIKSMNQSCLIILNTIRDTKLLYEALTDEVENLILLNTHFTPIDRKLKIAQAKKFLKRNEQIVVVSTQLIEAGVDIDFPIVYRDWCPLPSLIQSAGRCNREGRRNKLGKVIFIKLLKNDSKKAVAYSIYRDKANKRFLELSEENLPKSIQEKDLYKIQMVFFDFINQNIPISYFEYFDNANKKTTSMVECINNAKFETLGKFRLIPEQFFGEEYTYYIPTDEEDQAYECLAEEIQKLKYCTDYEAIRIKKEQIQNQFKVMQERIIRIRIFPKDDTLSAPPTSNSEPYYFNIRVLADSETSYSFEKGIDLNSTSQSFL